MHHVQVDKKVWRLLYGIEANQTQWAVCGYQRRQIDIADTTTFTVELLALREGDLEYPKIRLWDFREPQLQTVGNSRDLQYITEEPAASCLTALTGGDPLGADSPVVVRKRSVSTLPRAEKIDYTGGREKVKSVNTIVLNSLCSTDSLRELDSQCICAYNLLSLVSVGP